MDVCMCERERVYIVVNEKNLIKFYLNKDSF